ncbi:hypothetical protein JTB14_003833 [Gonioctena quinquepunctata]|nr:hypothetical protein JTB14_003833 [Gonioctena quinquepunctata]
MFLIPDEILESMSCDTCHKFLSTGPVKVYSNRRTKCGRCIRNNDEGAISQYNQMVQSGLFKCINRFDGCRQILTYKEVADHESTCRSKSYICPNCPVTLRIPTFLLVRHFKENHVDSFLDKSSFKVDVITPCVRTYLYRNKDDLFFVECESSTREVVDMDVFFIGDEKQASKIKAKFTVHYGSSGGKTETRTLKCSPYISGNYRGVPITNPIVESDFVFVEFEMHYQVSGEVINCPISQLSDPKLVNEVENVQTPLNKSLSELMKRGLQRTISLSSHFKDHPDIKLNLSSTRLIKGSDEIVPFCFNCSVPTPLRQNFLQIQSKKYQLLCWLCEKYYETKKFGMKLFYNEELLPKFLNYSVLYSCIWCCDGLYSWHHIFDHEAYCPSQPERLCPVPYCSYRGRLFDFEKHFDDIHPTDELSLFSRISVEKPTSPCSVTSYLWVSQDFVSLKFKWDGSQYRLTVSSCGGSDNCSDLQPRALLFIDNWANFLALVTTERPFVWKSEDWLFVKCYYGK